MNDAERRGLKRLLEEVDGHLGLAIYRGEGSTHRWKEEAREYRKRLELAALALLDSPTPKKCQATATMRDDRWGSMITRCDFDEGHAGEHGHAMGATLPEGAMLRWKGSTT